MAKMFVLNYVAVQFLPVINRIILQLYKVFFAFPLPKLAKKLITMQLLFDNIGCKIQLKRVFFHSVLCCISETGFSNKVHLCPNVSI